MPKQASAPRRWRRLVSLVLTGSLAGCLSLFPTSSGGGGGGGCTVAPVDLNFSINADLDGCDEWATYPSNGGAAELWTEQGYDPRGPWAVGSRFSIRGGRYVYDSLDPEIISVTSGNVLDALAPGEATLGILEDGPGAGDFVDEVTVTAALTSTVLMVGDDGSLVADGATWSAGEVWAVRLLDEQGRELGHRDLVEVEVLDIGLTGAAVERQYVCTKVDVDGGTNECPPCQDRLVLVPGALAGTLRFTVSAQEASTTLQVQVPARPAPPPPEDAGPALDDAGPQIDDAGAGGGPHTVETDGGAFVDGGPLVDGGASVDGG